MTKPAYNFHEIPGGHEVKVSLYPGQSLTVSIAGRPNRFARIALWEDDVGLKAAFVDIDARPIKRFRLPKEAQ